MPTSVLDEILKEVVLQEGDNVYLTLALVCTTFRDIVSTNYLRRRAHFQWLDSKLFNSSGIQYLSTVVFWISLWNCALLTHNFVTQVLLHGVGFLQRTKKLSAPCTPLTPALDVDDYIKTAHQVYILYSTWWCWYLCDYTQYHNYALITSVEVTCQYVFFPSFLFYRICWDRKKGSARSNLFWSWRSGILQSLLQPIAIGKHKFNTNTNPRLNYVTEMYVGLQKDPWN